MSNDVRRALAVAALFFGSCGSGDAPPPASTCTPGQSVACVGPAGCTGGQFCRADGRSFDVCVCTPGTPAVDGAAGTPDDGGADGPGQPPLPDAAPALPSLDAPPAPPPADASPEVALDTSPRSPDGPVTTPGPDARLRDELGIVPRQHDFGATSVGAISAPFTFTVFNGGVLTLSGLTVLIESPDFVALPAGNQCAARLSLPPGATCTIEVQFRPVSRGQKQGTLIASAGNQVVTVSLTGSAQAPPSLAIAPGSGNFLGVVGQMGTPVTFTVANVGDAPTGQVTVALVGTNADQFKVNSACLAPLAGAGICTAAVSFNPTSPGTKTATLTVSSPAGGMRTVMLTGTAN
jgi:hypothetical protein